MHIEIEIIRLDAPLPGITVARALDALAALNDPAIHAVVYVPDDLPAMKLFCDTVGGLSDRRRHLNKLNWRAANLRRDDIHYCTPAEARAGRSQPCALDLQRLRRHAPDACWQSACDNLEGITVALASQQVACRRVDYLSFHLATYLNDNHVKGFHIDPAWPIIGTVAETGTVLELEPGAAHVTPPAYHPFFFKQSRRHSAPDFERGITGAQRPRQVLTWDLGVERRLLD